MTEYLKKIAGKGAVHCVANDHPDHLQPMVFNALVRLLDGEETTRIIKQDINKNGKPTGYHKTTTIRSRSLPNAAVVVFLMERLFPEKFAGRPQVEISFQAEIKQFSGTFQAAIECQTNPLLSKIEPHKPCEWTVYVSPHVKNIQGQNRKQIHPLFKSL
jgi:hypothetical protein